VIVPVFYFKSARDYVERRNQVEIERPKKCSKCCKENCFWAHGHYEREVIEGGEAVTIRVPRFICSICSCTISCLFSFLIPYRRFTEAVSKAIEDYAIKKTTYREEAEEVSVLDSAGSPKPSHAQVFRWVRFVADKAESLLFLVQQELALKGKWDLIV
jgi:transposase